MGINFKVLIKRLVPFALFAWFVLFYNVLVILWGAYVRATGSGAGCGSHWPLCNGEFIPRTQAIETIVEFAHRVSSGVALLLVIVLVIWAYRSYPQDHIVRFGVKISAFFIMTESLVGALLVLFEWVALNQSIERVISVSVHLLNTFMLLGSLTLTAWWASGGGGIRLRAQNPIQLFAVGVGLFGMMILGITGAITALGDTLFPAGSLTDGIRQDFLPTAHFLVRLRVWHPVVAIMVGSYSAFTAALIAGLGDDQEIKKFAWGLGILFAIQLIGGIINLLLLAPVWMQLVHLFLADMVWIAFVLFSARLFKH